MYCIYHSRDLDGWMSAAIVNKYFNETTTISTARLHLIGWDYGDPLPVLKPGESVVMVDISFSMDDMLNLSETASMLIWIDHHKSAIQDFEAHDASKQHLIDAFLAIHDDTGEYEKIAACELTWNYFYPSKPLPEIVRLLGSYDSFRHKGTEEEQKVFKFQYAARAFMENPQDCYDLLNSDIDTGEWIVSGHAILEYLKVEARGIYAGHSRKLIQAPGGGKLLAATVNQARFNPKSFGIDFHADGYDVFICYHRLKTGMWSFSIYNDNGVVDASVLAKANGGGGHAGAAGFVAENISFIE